MNGRLVMVRAMGGEPAVVLLRAMDGETCAVSAPDSDESLFPIGFPLADVFEVEEQLFRDLSAAHGRRDHAALTTLWRKATPLKE
jgi:hypothetical protein